MTNKQAVRARRRLGLNQAQFWSRFGITQSAASRYESGRRIPMPLQKLLDIAYGETGVFSETINSLRKLTELRKLNGR